MSLQVQAPAGTVAIWAEEGEAQPEPTRKKDDSGKSPAKTRRCSGRSGPHRRGRSWSRNNSLLFGARYSRRRGPTSLLEMCCQAFSPDVASGPKVPVRLCHKITIRVDILSCRSSMCPVKAGKRNHAVFSGEKSWLDLLPLATHFWFNCFRNIHLVFIQKILERRLDCVLI